MHLTPLSVSLGVGLPSPTNVCRPELVKDWNLRREAADGFVCVRSGLICIGFGVLPVRGMNLRVTGSLLSALLSESDANFPAPVFIAFYGQFPRQAAGPALSFSKTPLSCVKARRRIAANQPGNRLWKNIAR